MKKYDVIIIGTGAGGGTLAQKLAPSGKRILLLERGHFLPKEIENWNPHEVYPVGRYRPKEQWLDKDANPFSPFTHYCVGGNTKVYGAALLRLRESDFGAVKHADGISPAWPVAYDEIEPYYTQAERLYSAHGTRGIDPTEPYASAPYPFPAVKPVVAPVVPLLLFPEISSESPSPGYHAAVLAGGATQADPGGGTVGLQ